MKKLFASYILLLIFGLGYSQKMAYVDTQYILKQMPQYQSSEQRLNNEVKKWQDQIVNQRSKIEKLRISFENEKILLTEDQQKKQLATIDSTEKVLNDFIDKKFGSNGESIALRYNLAKPLQDQIWNAINTVAAKDKYNIVFDKSSDLIMIFTDSKYDITDRVLKQLGVNDKNADKKGDGKTSSKNIKGPEPRTTDDREDDRGDEEVTGNSKPKSGYGSKYKPKKSAQKAEAKETTNTENTSSSKTSKTSTNTEETSKPKSGYGSKYVPKKKKETAEVPESAQSDTEKDKTSSNSKVGAKTTETSKAASGNKSTTKKKTETSDTRESTKSDAKGKSTTSSSSKVETKTEEDKTSSKDEVEIKTTETSKPKTGYGSKYVPKKKTVKTEK